MVVPREEESEFEMVIPIPFYATEYKEWNGQQNDHSCSDSILVLRSTPVYQIEPPSSNKNQ